jgi:hypothetical protein
MSVYVIKIYLSHSVHIVTHAIFMLVFRIICLIHFFHKYKLRFCVHEHVCM